MALAILDGTQTATTLSTILSSGQHITAHTVVSLGTQAITDILNATSAGLTNTQLRASAVTIGGTVTVGNSLTISSLPAISGTVTANVPVSVDGYTATTGIRVTGCGSDGGLRVQGIDPSNFNPANLEEGGGIPIFPVNNNPLPISGTIDIGSALPAGTNRIGVVTIGGGTVTIGAGTAQIGSVTASISNSVTIASFTTSVTARLINPAGTAVTYAEVGTAGNPSIDVLSVQGVTAGAPLNVYPMQGTTVSNTNFTSTTASTSLVSAVTGRQVLTVFNEGAGNLNISPGATATTISYQVRLSAGDYWECPQGQLSLAHTAVFATAGTARVTQVS